MDRFDRRSLRLGGYDYSQAGAYFFTICSQAREPIFGAVADTEVLYTEAGRLVEQVWHHLPGRFPTATLDAFILMPDHVHGILYLEGSGGLAPLPTILRAFKSLTAIEINRCLGRQGRPVWQRGYYERVLRDENELAGARRYIVENPTRWAFRGTLG